jgi:hypothetical protein
MDPDIGVDDPTEETVGQYSLVLLAPRRSDASALRRGLRRAAKSKRVEEGAAKVADRGNHAVDGPPHGEVGEGPGGEGDVDESRHAQAVLLTEANQRNQVAVEATRRVGTDDSGDEGVARDEGGADGDGENAKEHAEAHPSQEPRRGWETYFRKWAGAHKRSNEHDEDNERSEAKAQDEAGEPSGANAHDEANNRTGRDRPEDPDQPDAAKASPTPTAIVVRTGVGPRRSRKAARDDHLFTAQAIAVVGIGRALADRVQPGDVVVADQVRTDALTEGVVPPTRLVPSAPRIAALLRRQGLTVHVGSVISTDNRVNDTVRDRLAMTRALVADRESAWLLAACGKTPIACVRVAAHRSMRGWRKTARTLRIVSATLTEWAASS